MGEGRQNRMRLFERDSNKKILSILLIRNTNISRNNVPVLITKPSSSLSSSLRETNPKKKSILPSSFPKKKGIREIERERKSREARKRLPFLHREESRSRRRRPAFVEKRRAYGFRPPVEGKREGGGGARREKRLDRIRFDFVQI